MANEEPTTNPIKQTIAGQPFKLVAIVVGGFTFMAFLTHVSVAIFATETDAAKDLIDNCKTIYHACFGAFLGLFGGKSL